MSATTAALPVRAGRQVLVVLATLVVALGLLVGINVDPQWGPSNSGTTQSP